MSRLRSALMVAGSLFVLSACAPSIAGAYATNESPPNPSTATGLSDSRIYELVSPANKHGFEAGATGATQGSPRIEVHFSLARADGDAVVYGAVGPAAETNTSGLSQTFVAERTTQGWKSRSTMPRGLDQTEGLPLLSQSPNWLDYSPDLSHVAYAVQGADIPGAPAIALSNIYAIGSNPFEEPTWLLKEGLSSAVDQVEGTQLLGMSPDASVIYIAYEKKLLEQDSSRSGWGVYEYRNGKLSEAGILPDGSVPSNGALPSATASLVQLGYSVNDANNPASLDNQVSEDGMRMFFVAGGELYVHVIADDGSERSVLVSASQLPGHVGEAAPDGVSLFKNLTQKTEHEEFSVASAPTYAYASSDGSHVFFESEDQLTSQAPAGSEPKVYVFAVDTGLLEYLPGVSLGGIVTVAHNGSSLIFVNNAATPELDRWVAAADGGSVSKIVQLPGGGYVGPGRLVAGGSVLVFQASAPIAGFNNVGGEQIYRYDIQINRLGCVSCPPIGVKPSGNTYLSAVDQYGDSWGKSIPEDRTVNDVSGVSTDGERVLFDSPDPLVGRDTNGARDVYEWENGTVFLLSSGMSSEYSLFLDNGQSGGDVFFATTDELVHGDNDQGFDVYDARIPRSGDDPPPAAVPCQGDVCQGPPSVTELLGSPSSATFSGAGNIADESLASAAKSTPRRLSRAQKLANALRVCRKLKSKRKRSVCERQARRRHRAAAAAVKHDNGRGK